LAAGGVDHTDGVGDLIGDIERGGCNRACPGGEKERKAQGQDRQKPLHQYVSLSIMLLFKPRRARIACGSLITHFARARHGRFAGASLRLSQNCRGNSIIVYAILYRGLVPHAAKAVRTAWSAPSEGPRNAQNRKRLAGGYGCRGHQG